MSWHHFGLICSDLARYPVAWGVAASSAFPVVFSPIVLRNYAGDCPAREPAWVGNALRAWPSDGRRYYNAKSARSYADAGRRPWILLTDGGVSDNLGLHRALDAVTSEGSLRRFFRERGFGEVRRLAGARTRAPKRARRSLCRLQTRTLPMSGVEYRHPRARAKRIRPCPSRPPPAGRGGRPSWPCSPLS